MLNKRCKEQRSMQRLLNGLSKDIKRGRKKIGNYRISDDGNNIIFVEEPVKDGGTIIYKVSKKNPNIVHSKYVGGFGSKRTSLKWSKQRMNFNDVLITVNDSNIKRSLFKRIKKKIKNKLTN